MRQFCSMTRVEKIKAEAERIKAVKQWPARLRKLIRLKKKAGIVYSEAKFCKDNGFSPSRFNKGKNLESIPSQETVEKVEAAFEKESV